MEFESDVASPVAGMIMTWLFGPVAQGTEVTVTAEHVPSVIDKGDHLEGLMNSLANLAKFVKNEAEI